MSNYTMPTLAVQDDTDIVIAGTGHFIATTHDPASSVGTQDEYDRAAFIVRACNNYAKQKAAADVLDARVTELLAERARLVEALQSAAADLTATYEAAKAGKPLVITVGQFARLDAIRAALDAAKG